MSERGCGHCVIAGYVAGGVCKVATASRGGFLGSWAAGQACKAAVTSACERISHCSVTKSAEW